MTPRYHALDNLRGIIMWLGVVFHVSLNHLTMELPIPFKDSLTSPFVDLLFAFIHTFRMPAFFILAGFFTVILLAKAGPRAMLINRLKRIALPFALFLPIALIFIPIVGAMFVSKINLGYFSVDISRLFDSDKVKFNTYHLWFLYDLLWLCLLAALCHYFSRHIPKHWINTGASLLTKLATRWWGALFLTLPLAFCGLFYPAGFITPAGSLIPNIPEIIYYGSFFAFGCFFFAQKETLMAHYSRFCWRYFSAGIFMFMLAIVAMGMGAQGKLPPAVERLIPAFTYSIVGWLFSFVIIGIFIRYFNQHNRVLRYLAESSYWVYLTHFIATIGFGALLYDTSLPLLPKMLVNMLLTSAACLISYHLLVRFTWLGALLNGRRHSRSSQVEQDPVFDTSTNTDTDTDTDTDTKDKAINL